MKLDLTSLSRREREIMDILFRLGEATVEEVRAEMPDPPTAAAVRAVLLRLADKARLSKKQAGQRNVFAPSMPREVATRSALNQLIHTFFRGSRRDVVTSLLEEGNLTEEELDQYERLLEEARKRTERK